MDVNNVSSEYGRFYGGVINFATKSGTNDFHGGVSEYFRNTVLNANNTFNIKANIKRPPLEQNQYSAWLGGPVVKNKAILLRKLGRVRQQVWLAVCCTCADRTRARWRFQRRQTYYHPWTKRNHHADKL